MTWSHRCSWSKVLVRVPIQMPNTSHSSHWLLLLSKLVRVQTYFYILPLGPLQFTQQENQQKPSLAVIWSVHRFCIVFNHSKTRSIQHNNTEQRNHKWLTRRAFQNYNVIAKYHLSHQQDITKFYTSCCMNLNKCLE